MFDVQIQTVVNVYNTEAIQIWTSLVLEPYKCVWFKHGLIFMNIQKKGPKIDILESKMVLRI